MNSKNRTNDTCGCCKGITALTPAALDNLPGLPAMSYRVGTQGSFKTTMRAALSGQKVLDGLTIRDDDDPSVALIDAWACVLDVLTFYQERIANEGYLPTAAERSSVLELARAIGYELNPGVAASTFLAFTVDDAPGTPGYATIDTGVKVMSIPGQNEKPQTFETIENIDAKAIWNALKPRLTELIIPGFGSKEVYLKGAATGLKPGDGLLFVGKEREHDPGSERWDFRIVKTAAADIAAGYTQVTWDEGLGWQRFKRKVLPAEEEFRVYAFRQHTSIFGFNAPDWRILPDAMKASYLGLKDPSELTDDDKKEWPSFTIFAPEYPLKPGSQVISYRTIKPTPESVAAAATSAAQAMVTEAANNTVAAAANSANSAANAAQKLVDVAENAKKAVEKVANIAADGVRDATKQVILSKIESLRAINEPFQIRETVKETLTQACDAIDSRKAELTTIITGLGTPEEVVKAVINEVYKAIGVLLSNPLTKLIAGKAIENAKEYLKDNSLTPSEIVKSLTERFSRPPSLKEVADETLTRAKDIIINNKDAIINASAPPLDDKVFADFKNKINADSFLREVKTAANLAFTNITPGQNPIINSVESIFNIAKSPVEVASMVEEKIKNIMNAGISFGINEIISIQSNIENVASTAASIASETATAVTPEFEALRDLSDKIREFADATGVIARDFVTAASAARSAALVAAVTQAALKLPPVPASKSKLDFVSDATVAAAEAGSLLAENDADGAKAVLAGAGLAGAGPGILIPLGVAAVVAEEFKPQAKAGAEKVRKAIKDAVELARQDKIEQVSSQSSQRLQYELTKDSIDLDTTYKQIAAESWAVLSLSDNHEVYKVTKVSEASRAEYSLTGKTTRLKLEGENIDKFEKEVRPLVVYAQSEQLDIAEAPRTDTLSGNVIELDGLVSGLERGKFLIISGKRMRALVTQAGMELVSVDGEKRKPLRQGDVLLVLEPPVKSGKDSMSWILLDRSGFTGSVTAPNDSIRQMPAAKDDKAVSEMAELDGVFEKATPEKLKVVEAAFNNDVAAATKAGMKRTGQGEAFENGYYRIAGWNGESYAALNGKGSKLARLFMEQDTTEKTTVNEGGVWDIGGGWKLAVAKINANATKAQLVLIKDGTKKNEKDVAKGSVYTYIEKSIAGETDVPLFVTYIDDISTIPTRAVQFKYTWAVDTNVTEVKVGDKSGISDEAAGGGTILVLKQPMTNNYDPATVIIYANVARATHGETVREVLGSGSGAQANQVFGLKKQPLTYVSAPTPSGTESTIEVRVNNLKWQEVPSLYGLDARLQGYIIRIDDDGNTALTFGDGKNGARLPTGVENVVAAYRTGIGMQGMVKAEQLSLLMTRPLGVKGVTNPLAPSGAADPETRDQARQNAPQKVLTLDRIVALQDFEDFTRAFTGIGKAQAAWISDGEVRFVHITVASANAGSVDKTSDLYQNLWLGIENAKDPVQQFRIDSFNPLSFNLSASVLVDDRCIKGKVLAAVLNALKQVFSFSQRSFGQAVTESEVVAVIQGVEGVKAVDLNALYLKEDMPALYAYLKAARAYLDNGTLRHAELLTLNPDGIELTEMRL